MRRVGVGAGGGEPDVIWSCRSTVCRSAAARVTRTGAHSGTQAAAVALELEDAVHTRVGLMPAQPAPASPTASGATPGSLRNPPVLASPRTQGPGDKDAPRSGQTTYMELDTQVQPPSMHSARDPVRSHAH